MDHAEMDRANLERRVSDAGWHIVRDEEVADGYLVEFQRGDYTDFHPGAETRISRGPDRDAAYRRFLDELAAEQPLTGSGA